MKRIHNLSSRHPGESRDPVPFAVTASHSHASRWVPAFAGMTASHTHGNPPYAP